jgi:hypothetical protein
VIVEVVVVMCCSVNDDDKSLNVKFSLCFCFQFMMPRSFLSLSSVSARPDVIIHITYAKHSETEEPRIS